MITETKQTAALAAPETGAPAELIEPVNARGEAFPHIHIQVGKRI